jgi:hypothetical protein
MLIVVGALLGCPRPTATNPPPAATGQATVTDPGPNSGQVDIVFRGLIAFVFKGESDVRSVFLSPGGAEHMPLLAIETANLDASNASDPDYISTGTGDSGLAVWKFSEVSLDLSNVTENKLGINHDKLDLVKPDYGKLRWVPYMDDIFGSGQKVDQKAIDAAAARGTWTAGVMTPIFDRESHETEKWDIGQRMGTPVADGVRLRVTLADAGKPLVLNLTRNGKETISVAGGGTVLLSAYPKNLPKPGEDMKHFHHFYDLRDSAKTGPYPKKSFPPTPYPVRCAPSIYYPVTE